MKKQTIILFALFSSLLATKVAFANGFYVNAAILEAMSNNTFQVYSPSTNTTFTKKLKNGHFLGNIALGYGYDLPRNFYIGSELTANIGKIIADITRVGVLYQDQIFHNQTTIQDYVALDITPGFKINNNLLLYARMGMVDGKISITQDTIPSVVGFQNSANKVGGRLGLGIDYTIANFGVGADYIYSFYSSFDTKSPRNTEYNLIPRSHILGLHVRYNFK
ncbi:MAG: hypothetical protein WCW01_05390 [Gammaproteobacteria bacterium]